MLFLVKFFRMKKIALVIVWILFIAQLQGQDKKVLILIDIQDFYFPGGAMPLHEPEVAAKWASEALDLFRKNGWPVVHIQHAYGPSGTIHALVSPLEGEVVITKKEVNAFSNTHLLEVLRSLDASELVFAGMQTHMCLEAAVRAAKDFGFKCVVLADACATRELTFDSIVVPASHVHGSTLATLNRTYARVVSTAVWKEEVAINNRR
jgi:nicotinamidase-related amidase